MPTCLDFFAGSGLVAEGLKGFFQTVWANDICEKRPGSFAPTMTKMFSILVQSLM